MNDQELQKSAIAIVPAETSTNQYFTKKELAERLRVSHRTIDNLMARRLLPYVKLTSKIVRFPVKEVENYIHKNLRINARNE